MAVFLQRESCCPRYCLAGKVGRVDKKVARRHYPAWAKSLEIWNKSKTAQVMLGDTFVDNNTFHQQLLPRILFRAFSALKRTLLSLLPPKDTSGSKWEGNSSLQ